MKHGGPYIWLVRRLRGTCLPLLLVPLRREEKQAGQTQLQSNLFSVLDDVWPDGRSPYLIQTALKGFPSFSLSARLNITFSMSDGLCLFLSLTCLQSLVSTCR